jgi:RhoGEF domain
VSDKALTTLFCNIDQILTTSSTLCAALTQCSKQEPEDRRVGGILIDNQQLLRAYVTYCRNQTTCMRSLDALRTSTFLAGWLFQRKVLYTGYCAHVLSFCHLRYIS